MSVQTSKSKATVSSYQLEDCRRAVAQHGHRLLRVYSDPGISGTVEDRPGLNELRRDAQQGQFDVLYFWKSDRLARDEILQLTLYREFRRLGLETCSVSEPNMNDLMRGIYAVFGAEDLRNIKAKTYSGRLRAIRAGKWMGPPPYGYVKNAEFKLVAHPPEAAVVKQFFEWCVSDHLALYALTKRANEHQIPTRFDNRRVAKPRNGIAYWSVGTLRNLLRREYYATGQARITVRPELGQISGPRSGASEEVLISIPPLISLDLFERAQEQLRHNSDTQAGRLSTPTSSRRSSAAASVAASVWRRRARLKAARSITEVTICRASDGVGTAVVARSVLWTWLCGRASCRSSAIPTPS